MSAPIARCGSPIRNSPTSSWWTWWRAFRKAKGSICSSPARSRATTSSITGANDYEPTANSDIAIITAGFPRKPGMSRDDLLMANYEVVRTATEQVAKYSPNCIIIVVTNPLDAMAQAAFWVSKFSKNRVVGMAGVLDSARFRTFIAQELKVSVENVTGVVMGGHGDTMVPLVRLSNVVGNSAHRTDGPGDDRQASSIARATAARRS